MKKFAIQNIENRNWFEKIALFFGRDLIVSHWLKQYQGKTIEEIFANMNENQLNQAVGFLGRNAAYVASYVNDNAFIDVRVRTCFVCIRQRRKQLEKDIKTI